jgi:hypothetical protein
MRKVTQSLQEWIISDNSKVIRNTMKVIGSYGIIVVFAQDIGLRTGCKQALFSHNLLVQFFMFTAVAYSVTDDFFQSISGTVIYFVLKYVLSQNRLNDVCFPTENEINQCDKA